MLHFEKNLKDIDKQKGFKELRTVQETYSCHYQLCEELTHEIAMLKTQHYQQQMIITVQRAAIKMI